jgi:hypothetical protein
MRNWRRRIQPKTEIENRHREIIDIRARHRFVQALAEANDERACFGERVLQIHRQQRIVLDNQPPDSAQRMTILRRLNHLHIPADCRRALSDQIVIRAKLPPTAHVPCILRCADHNGVNWGTSVSVRRCLDGSRRLQASSRLATINLGKANPSAELSSRSRVFARVFVRPPSGDEGESHARGGYS